MNDKKWPELRGEFPRDPDEFRRLLDEVAKEAGLPKPEPMDTMSVHCAYCDQPVTLNPVRVSQHVRLGHQDRPRGLEHSRDVEMPPLRGPEPRRLPRPSPVRGEGRQDAALITLGGVTAWPSRSPTRTAKTGVVRPTTEPRETRSPAARTAGVRGASATDRIRLRRENEPTAASLQDWQDRA